VDEIFILTCDTYCPTVVQFVTRRDFDEMPLGLYEVRENQHRKGRNFHWGINEITLLYTK